METNGAPPANGDSGVGLVGEAAGYAVVRGSCIVEMMTLAKFPTARVQLLARACRDAIDRDHHSISLYTPASDPLHELMVTAGGAWISDRKENGPRLLMRLLSPERWVERCYPLWRQRAPRRRRPAADRDRHRDDRRFLSLHAHAPQCAARTDGRPAR